MLKLMFRKEELNWGNQCETIIDRQDNIQELDLDIVKEINKIYSSTLGAGFNPHVVNFFSFCGHGIVINSDAHFLIPVKPQGGDPYIYALNVDRWAREFSSKDNSINIFLFSACRSPLETVDEEVRELLRFSDDITKVPLELKSLKDGLP